MRIDDWIEMGLNDLKGSGTGQGTANATGDAKGTGWGWRKISFAGTANYNGWGLTDTNIDKNGTGDGGGTSDGEGYIDGSAEPWLE